MGAAPEGLRLGARLQGGRERAGLTVIQAAERLHVDPHVIEALEAERFEELGASVYVRGHIRHYAELIGESAAELQELYAASAHSTRKPDLTRVPRREDPTAASRALLIPAVLVVAAVAVIGTAWWVAGTLSAASRAPHRSAAPPQRTAPEAVGAAPKAVRAVAAAAVVEAPSSPARAGGSTAASAPGSTTPMVLTPTLTLTPRAPTPRAPTGAATAATAAVAAVGPAGTASSMARPVETPHPRVAALRLHFAEDSWAEVYDARGERLFYDVGPADSTRTVSGTPPLKIVLGNPAGVSLELDGRPVSIPGGAQRNMSIEFRITRSGRVAPSHLAAAGAHRASAAPVPAP